MRLYDLLSGFSPGESTYRTPLSCVVFLIACNSHFRFMTDAARREQESLKKKIQPKLSLTLSSSVSRGNVSTPPRHSSGSLTPPVTPPITPSSSFRSSTPTGKPQSLGLRPTTWILYSPLHCVHSFICYLQVVREHAPVCGDGFIGF